MHASIVNWGMTDNTKNNHGESGMEVEINSGCMIVLLVKYACTEIVTTMKIATPRQKFRPCISRPMAKIVFNGTVTTLDESGMNAETLIITARYAKLKAATHRKIRLNLDAAVSLSLVFGEAYGKSIFLQRSSAGTAGARVSVETGWRVKVAESMADRAAPAVVQSRLVRPRSFVDSIRHRW